MTNQSVTQKGRKQSVDPEELLRVALEIFVRDGYAGAKLDEIARGAQVAKGTIYLYFPSKQDLFKAVVRRFVVPSIASFKKDVAEHQGSMADFLQVQLVRFWMHIMHSDLCSVVRLVFTEGSRFPEVAELYYQEAVVRGLEVFGDILKIGVKNGEFREDPSLHQPQILIAPVLTALFWQSLYKKSHPIDDELYLKTFADLLLHGLVKDKNNAR